MSYEDPVTVEGYRSLVTPYKDQDVWFVAIRLDGHNFRMSLDDARGFAQRVQFATEVARRNDVEERLDHLERYR